MIKKSFRIDEVAELLSLSKRSIYRHIRNGIIPVISGASRVPVIWVNNIMNGKMEAVLNGQDRLMTIPEVFGFLNVSLSTIHGWIDEGTLDAVKVGKRKMVFKSDVIGFVKPVYE